jgi:hypothetical protein
MATSLNNVDEDLLFYEEIKKYVYTDPNPVNLTSKINAHNKWAIQHGLMQIETWLEFAISNVSGITHAPATGMDFSDGSDAKKVTSLSCKSNEKTGRWENRYKIKGIKNKKGILRVMAYNRVKQKFEYFAIPYEAYQHINGDHLNITLDSYSGYYDHEPEYKGEVRGRYAEYMVKDFNEMATFSNKKSRATRRKTQG